MQLLGAEVELSDGDFRRFAGLVYAASGIHLTDQKKELLRARLRKRLRALKLDSFKEYFGVVTAHGAEGELKALLDAVSTNKTEFFREAKHFEHLRDTVVPEWLASGEPAKGPLRIWSAASSSGEEIYTLAMVLHEALEGGKGDFKILGTDISTRMLDKAVAGVYESRHIAAIPGHLRQKYFLPVDGQGVRDATLWSAGEALRAKTAFGRLNLNEGSLPFDRPLDVVFCRNVMIYFDRPTQEALIAKITSVLKPGGWLYTGLSESLLAIRHDLKTVAPSIYRKAL
jgi:chemotaxis protein methyltransferase CheR